MRTVTVNVYTLAELKQASPEGYKRAVKNWRKTTCEDPAWSREYSEALKRALAALGDDPPRHVEGARRCMAWLENNVLAPLRISFHGKERWRLFKYGEYYRAGRIKPCPWTGFHVDEALLDLLVKLARNGVSPQHWARRLSAKYDTLWDAEVADQCTEEYFAEACEANGYEFHEDGSTA